MYIAANIHLEMNELGLLDILSDTNKFYPKLNKSDMILPVPLHPQKLKLRGFNQSELLARGLSRSLDVKVSHDLLYKSKATSSQTRKGHYERWLNVNGVFSLSIAESFQAAHVLLVDDLVTTGSTLEACCNTLLKVPGLKVSVLTIGYVAK